MTAIAAVYVSTGVFLVVTQLTLNDEGLLTYYWARWLRSDFSATFFFQKLKPVLCLIYAVPAIFGIQAMMLVHVLVAASAVPLMAATARSLGHRLPNAAALVVAFSPLYFFGGSAGFANNDGVVGMTLVLYLLCARRRPLMAGFVAGLLPWVRAELATFTAVVAIYAVFTSRDRWYLAGMVVFPLVYAISGAAYHHDALWLLHYPPAAPVDPDNPMWNVQLIGFRFLLEPAAAVTPLAALALLLPAKRLGRIERALVAYVLLNVVTINVFPMFRLGNFGTAPRYLVHVLPALALLIGRALERCFDEHDWPPARTWLAVGLAACWIATRQQDVHGILVLLIAYAVVLTLVALRANGLAVAAAILMAVCGPLMPLRTETLRPAYLESMLAWFDSQQGARPRTIYTNAHLLAPYLERRLPDVNVFDLATPEMIKELIGATDADNGQRAAIVRLCTSDLFGKMLLPPVSPDQLGNGALLALRQDPRLGLLLPDELWSKRLKVLIQGPEFRIARVVPQPEAG